MAKSYNQVTANGSVTSFAVTFPYLDRSHVFAKVAGSPVDFTWVSSGSVSITPAPAAGSSVRVYRRTPSDAPSARLEATMVDTADPYNQIAVQMLYRSQEDADDAADAQATADAANARSEAENARLDSRIDEIDGTVAIAAKDAAIAAKDTAVSASSTALASATTATTAKSSAETARDAALAYANVKDTISAGRASVADGALFAVIGTGDIAATLYRRTSSTTQTQVGAVATKSFIDDINARVRPGNITYEMLPAGSGYLEAVLDENRRLLQAFTAEGYLEARLSPKSYVPREALSPDAISGLLPSGVSYISMPQGSGWKIVFVTSDNRVIGGFTEQDRFWAKLADDVTLPQPMLDLLLSSQNYLPTTDIAAFGDSITEGVASYDTWSSLLATMLGVTVSNQGKGSQKTAEIVARQGGTPMRVSVAGDTIPASGSVNVTAFDVNIGRYGGVPAWLSTPGTLAGVPGQMRGNQDSETTPGGTYTFVRSVAGDPVACPPNTPFIATAGVTYRGWTQIHGCGRNDVASLGDNAVVTDLLNRIFSMGSYLSPKIKRRLVIGVYSSPNEYATASGSNATNYNGIVAFNARLQAELGNQFLDIQKYLITEGLAAVGLTPTAADLTDIGRNTVPRSLLHTDLLHLNSYGALAFAIFIARRLRALGWY